MQDMTLLSTITNESINENLKARFQNQEIYVGVLRRGRRTRLTSSKTDIAHVLISVNPFRGELASYR